MMRILCYHWRRDTFEILCRFFHADATLKVILDLMLFHMTRSQINDTFLFQSGVKVKVVGEMTYMVGKLWISASIWHQAIEI